MQMGILSKKAVSPIIASILLVFIAISIGCSVYFWYSSIKEETQIKSEIRLTHDLSRVFAGIEIIKVNLTSGKVLVENTGGVILHGLNLTKNLEEIATLDSLDVGEIWEVEVTSLSSGDVLYVTSMEGASDKYEI